jgi:TRAP-type C4-dicarboxylate transport system permease small subunit
MIAGITRLGRIMAGGLGWVAVAGLVLIMLITWADVLGSKLFVYPVPGLTDIVTSLHLVVIASAIAATEVKGLHVRVLFFVQKLPKRVQIAFSAFAAAVTVVYFIVLAWQGYELGVSLFTAGETTSTILIPLWPLAFWLALCSIPACLVFLSELLLSVFGGTKE